MIRGRKGSKDAGVLEKGPSNALSLLWSCGWVAAVSAPKGRLICAKGSCIREFMRWMV